MMGRHIDWANGFNSIAFKETYKALNSMKQLDCGLAVSGSCFDKYDGELESSHGDTALGYFIFRLLQKLQSLGTVPAIDWNAYAAAITNQDFNKKVG